MKEFTRICKKALALLLCLVMCISCMFSAFAAAELIDDTLLHPDRFVTDEKYYNVTKGVVEKHIVLNNGAQSNQIRNYILEVDLSNPDLSIVTGYNNCDSSQDWGMKTLPAQVLATEKNRGLNVVAGVNGGNYNTKTGEPVGLLIMDGKQVHEAAKEKSFFAILKDGTAVIRRAGDRTDDVKEAISAMFHTVENGKVLPIADESVHPRTAVGIKADGTVVFMVSDGRQSPDSCGMTISEQADTMVALGCVDAVALDGGGSSTFMCQREAMSNISVRNHPCYGFNRPIASSLMICTSATPSGEFDHISFNETKYVVHPQHSVIINYAACDENGFKTDLPKGKLVVQDASYGSIIGNSFLANDKEGVVTIDYVADGEVLDSVDVHITKAADNFFEAGYNNLVRVIGNIIDMIKFYVEKFKVLLA